MANRGHAGVEEATRQTAEVFTEIEAVHSMMQNRVESGAPPARDRPPKSCVAPGEIRSAGHDRVHRYALPAVEAGPQ